MKPVGLESCVGLKVMLIFFKILYCFLFILCGSFKDNI
jgi:hypothetical protein